MSGTPMKKPMRQKAKRSPARVAGSKKAPTNAAFLVVPEKAADKTPPMTATPAGSCGYACGPTSAQGGTTGRPPQPQDGGRGSEGYIHGGPFKPNSESSQPANSTWDFRPTLTVTGADCGIDVEVDEDGDVVPELLRRAGSLGSSVSESTLWEHVGLQAGLSVSTATVPHPQSSNNKDEK